MKKGACPLFLVVLLLSGCARYANPSTMTTCGGCPKPAWKSINAHLVNSALVSPLTRQLNILRTTKRIVHKPTPAKNLKYGQVSNSAFMEDRRPAELSADQVRWGPTDRTELPQPPYHIRKIKDEGKTGGFFGKDARGHKYLFKLDPYDAPGLMSGTEVVTSKLLHALGYRVPSYEVLYIKPHELILTEEALDDEDDLEELFESHLRADGTLRVAASRFIEGEIIGSPRFTQFKDCAEVRALRLAYAWVNNIDTKDHNALLVKKDNHEVVYLIDFGSAFGANANTEKSKEPCSGWQYTVDLTGILRRTLSLGLSKPTCDRSEPFSPAIGRFSAFFDPSKWKPYVFNRTFMEMTPADAQWFAKRVAEFTPEKIEAAVTAGQYERAEDAEYLVKTLIARRDKIVEMYGDAK